MFIFQLSQINQQEQLAELLLKHCMVFATFKFYVDEIHSPLHLPLEPDATFKNNAHVKY